MELVLDIVTFVLLIAGSAITLIGTLGLLRLPDVYARMHATGMTDTLGAMLIVLGLVLQSESVLMAIKLLMIVAFLVYTSPVSTHALARSAIAVGLKPWLNDGDETAETEKDES